MKCIILAAGTKRRLGQSIAEPLAHVHGTEMVLRVVDTVRSVINNCEIIIVINPQDVEAFSRVFENDERVSFVFQERPTGTGKALLVALDAVEEDEELLVMFSDLVLIRDSSVSGMINLHSVTDAEMTILTGLSENRLPYAFVERTDDGRVRRIRNIAEKKKEGTLEFFIGPLFTDARTVRKIGDTLLDAGEREGLDVFEIIQEALKQQKRIQALRSLDESEYVGVNTLEDLKNAEDVLLMREAEQTNLFEEREIVFGTGGWRARIGRGFTSLNVRKIIQAVSNHVIASGGGEAGVVIGYDHRFLSREFAELAAETFAANNIRVLLSRSPLPTPVVTFTVVRRKSFCGVIFTASHNPSDYNGIKLETSEGLPAPIETTDMIQKEANTLLPERIPWVGLEDALEHEFVRIENFRNDYLDDLEKKIDYSVIKRAGLRVCFDPMHGSGTSTLQIALTTARCDLVTINSQRDPLFGGRSPSPAEKSLSMLKQFMKENEFDIGIAVDGDADRIALVSEKGRFIGANEVILLLYYYLKKVKGLKGGLVRNLSTSHNIDILCGLLGEEAVEVPVGFKHIAGAMKERDLLMGGESSGGVAFKGHILEKDGVYAAMLVTEMLAVMKKSVSRILSEIYSMIKKRYYFREEEINLTPTAIVKLEKVFSKPPNVINDKKVQEINRADGLKMILEDGSWVLLRKSGTESLVRIAGESWSKKEADKLVKETEKLVL